MLRRGVFVTVIIMGILSILEIVRELHGFVVKDYTITTNKLNGLNGELRAVFLSDLHNKSYGKDNEELISAIKAARPDLILITGDMLVAKRHTKYDQALPLLTKLPEIAPVYMSNGNHEQRLKDEPEKYGDFSEYKAQLLKAGIHLLENESEYINLYGARIKITGLELHESTYKKIGCPHLTKADMEACVGPADAQSYQVLLAHNPAFFEAYKNWGADLTLSGHLHGGVVRIPGWRGIITPQLRLFPKYSGEMTAEAERVIVVSRGLGTHTVHLRLFNQAEMIVLHFTGES